MNFITQADLLRLIDQVDLDDITNDDPTNVDLAEQAAIDEAFGYLNVRHNADAELTKTGTDRHAKLVEVIADMTIYAAHASIASDNVPELRETRYTAAITWLEKVASGFINPKLDVKAEEPTTTTRWGNASGIEKQENFY